MQSQTIAVTQYKVRQLQSDMNSVSQIDKQAGRECLCMHQQSRLSLAAAVREQYGSLTAALLLQVQQVFSLELFTATARGDAERVQLLPDSRVDVDADDSTGALNTPLQ